MTVRRFGAGARVAVEGGAGTVVAYRDLPEGQVLTVRGDDGRYRSVATGRCRGAAAQVLAPPVDLEDARALALAALSGRARTIPVTSQIAILAAVVALSDAAEARGRAGAEERDR